MLQNYIRTLIIVLSAFTLSYSCASDMPQGENRPDPRIRLVATGNNPQTRAMWNINTITQPAFSRDGKTVMYTKPDGTLTLIEVAKLDPHTADLLRMQALFTPSNVSYDSSSDSSSDDE